MRPFAFPPARDARRPAHAKKGAASHPAFRARPEATPHHRGRLAESETLRSNPRPDALRECGVALRVGVTLRGGEVAEVRRVIAIAARHRALVRGLVALL